MSSLRERMDRAADGFRPRRDWLEGAMERARRRQRWRRVVSGVVALVVFAASFTVLWAALRPGGETGPVGASACPRMWMQDPTERTSGGFAAVAGTGAEDMWAVGPREEYRPGSETVIQHWDGETWKRVPSPNGATGPGAVNELHGLVAVSPTDAWAVGEYTESLPISDGNPARVLIERWDGTTWSVVPAPNPSAGENRLNAVAAAGVDDVWAVGLASVGTRAATLVEHWDGRRWSVVPTPDLTSGESGESGASLDAIAVVSPRDIWAVGSQPSGVLIEHWDGTAWTVADAPQPEDHGFLTDVDASGPDDVWTVGWTTSDGIRNEATPPVVMRFDGARWEIVELPAAAAKFVVPLAITAVSPEDVWVGGWLGDSNDAEDYDQHHALVAHWDGSGWTFPDVGLDRSPQVLAGATNTGGDVWFVGWQSGAYDAGNGWLEGDRALAVVGECAG